MRGLIAVVIILVIVAAGWSGAWFWLADWADRQAPGVLSEIARRGVEVECRDRGVVGFPFAMRITCAETDVAERSTGTRAKLGVVTGGASVFAPTTARIDMASPVQVNSPLLEAPAEIRWRDAGVDVGIGLGGPSEVSFDAADLQAVFALADLPDPGLSATRAGGTVAPADDGGTEAAVTFTDLSVSADGAAFPVLSGSASGHLSVPPRALLAGRAGLEAPITARAIDIKLDSRGARLNAIGALSVDADGRLSGEITLRIAGADQLPSFIAQLPPQMQNLGNAFIGALFAFGRPAEIDGDPASEVVVEFERGIARVGLLELGLPRIPL